MNTKEPESLGTNIEECILPRVPQAELVPKEWITKGLSQKEKGLPASTFLPFNSLPVMLIG